MRALDYPVLPLWPDAPDTPDTERVVPCEADVTLITDVSRPGLLPCLPKGPVKGAVIVCPGGGYQELLLDEEGTEMAEWLAGLGLAAYVLKYRVPDRREEALADARQALKLVREKHGPDCPVGLAGFSAGAHLAARCCAAGGADFCCLIYSAYLDQEEGLAFGPEMPPVFLLQASNDRYARSSLACSKALLEAGISQELHLLPRGGHGFALRPRGTVSDGWQDRYLKRWLEKRLNLVKS